MPSEASRAAAAKYRDRRQSEGFVMHGIWLRPDDTAKLEQLAIVHGSKAKALSFLLNPPPEAPKVALRTVKAEPAVVSAIQNEGLDVQLGPTPVAPGSRLKKR